MLLLRRRRAHSTKLQVEQPSTVLEMKRKRKRERERRIPTAKSVLGLSKRGRVGTASKVERKADANRSTAESKDGTIKAKTTIGNMVEKEKACRFMAWTRAIARDQDANHDTWD